MQRAPKIAERKQAINLRFKDKLRHFFKGGAPFCVKVGDGGPEVIIYSFILVLFCQEFLKMRGKQIYENQRCIRYISAEIRL